MQVVCDIIILSPVTALADAAQELVRVEAGDLVLRRLLHHNALVGVCVRDHHHEPVPHKPKQTLHRCNTTSSPYPRALFFCPDQRRSSEMRVLVLGGIQKGLMIESSFVGGGGEGVRN
jgi:hypothetical protein